MGRAVLCRDGYSAPPPSPTLRGPPCSQYISLLYACSPFLHVHGVKSLTQIRSRMRKGRDTAPPLVLVDMYCFLYLTLFPICYIPSAAKLFEDEDDGKGEQVEELHVNESYARKFQHNKEREDLQRLESKHPELAAKLAAKAILAEVRISALVHTPPLFLCISCLAFFSIFPTYLPTCLPAYTYTYTPRAGRVGS